MVRSASNMVIESQRAERGQRVRTEIDECGGERRVKIRTESFDPALGWYTSGSVTLPLHQLPLLEQALAEMRHLEAAEEECQIIPFPGMAETAAGKAACNG